MRTLRAQPGLQAAAEKYSEKMVREKFFAHVSPDGSTLASRVRRIRYLDGARSWTLAENLGWGEGAASSPREIVVAWMASSGHRANILNPKLRDIGIGIASGGPKLDSAGATYTTDFGTRTRGNGR